MALELGGCEIDPPLQHPLEIRAYMPTSLPLASTKVVTSVGVKKGAMREPIWFTATGAWRAAAALRIPAASSSAYCSRPA